MKKINALFKAFSLAELMIVMLILAIILAATMPILSKRAKIKAAAASSGNSLWAKMGSSNDIYYGSPPANNNRVAIGPQNSTSFGSTDARLLLNTTDVTQNQIAFQQAGTSVGKLFMDNIGNIGLGSVTNTTSSSGGSIAIGQKAVANSYAGVSIGNYANYNVTGGNSSIAIGSSSKSSEVYSIAIGSIATATAYGVISIGSYANNNGTPGSSSIAIGQTTLSAGTSSLAIGSHATSYSNYSIAIGSTAETASGADGSVAIGCDSNGGGAKTTTTNQIMLGTSLHSVNVPGTLAVTGATTLNGNVTLGDATSDTVTVKGILSFGTGSVASGGNSTYTLRMNSTSGSVYYGSDKRMKNINGESKDGLEKIKQLKVYNYAYKNDKNKTPQVGVIAQDLQKVFPHAVEKQKNGYLMIRREDMFYAMINSIKQLDNMFQGIANEIKLFALRIQKVEDKIIALAKFDEATDKRIKQLEYKNKQLEYENKQLKNKDITFEKRLRKLEQNLR